MTNRHYIICAAVCNTFRAKNEIYRLELYALNISDV